MTTRELSGVDRSHLTLTLASPVSYDLSPLDFFVWGRMKQEVYWTPVNSQDELKNRNELTVKKVREKLTLNVTVRAMRKRARACIRKRERQFENKLQLLSMSFSFQFLFQLFTQIFFCVFLMPLYFNISSAPCFHK